MGTSHIKQFFFFNCKPSQFTRQLASLPSLLPATPAFFLPAPYPRRARGSRPLPGARLVPPSCRVNGPPSGFRGAGAAGRGRAPAPAAAAPAPAPRRPTPGSASLGRAGAGAGAAHVARAESPSVTARGGWRRRRRAGEGGCRARGEGRGGEGSRGEGAAGEAPPPQPPARPSREEPPPPPPRPSECRRGWRAGRSRGPELEGGSRESAPTTFPSPHLDGSGGVPAAAADRGDRAGGRHFGVGAEVSSGESAPRPLQQLAEYVPTRCPPSAKCLSARANLGRRILRAAPALGGAGVQGRGLGAAAAGRRGRTRALVDDSRRESVRRGSEKRASRAAGPTCAFRSQKARGAASTFLTRLWPSRAALSARGLCAVGARAGPGVLQPLSAEAESFCWFVYFRVLIFVLSILSFGM